MSLRLAREEELEACRDFADKVFQGAGADVDFGSALPKVYAPGSGMAHIHALVTDERDSIRAMVGMLPGELHVGRMVLRTGFIGSVSVHPEDRGRGYMKELMAYWLREARATGVDLLLLGGQRQRYGYFGYGQGGQRWVFHISARSVRHALSGLNADGIRFEPLLPGTPLEAACAALQQREPVRFGREWTGFAAICRSYEREVYAALDRSGRLLGCLTVKREEPDQLSELLAVTDRAMDLILKAWLTQRSLTNLWLQMPCWDSRRLRHLRLWAEGTSLSPAWELRVVNHRRVIETLMNLKARREQPADGELPIVVEDEAFLISVRDGRCKVGDIRHPDGTSEKWLQTLFLTPRQLNSMLFDPFPGEDIPQGPAGWFPLPLSVPTADEF